MGKIIDIFGRDRNNIGEKFRYLTAFKEYYNLSKDLLKIEFDFDFMVETGYSVLIHSWGYGNLKQTLPKSEFDQMLMGIDPDDDDYMYKLIEIKTKEFSEFPHFITGFDFNSETRELEDVSFGDITDFMQLLEKEVTALKDFGFFEDIDDEGFLLDDFEEDLSPNYVNRQAIILTIRKPYVDWVNSFESKLKRAKLNEQFVFLLEEEQDGKRWMSKFFDVILREQFEASGVTENNWPVIKDYATFKKWFGIAFSPSVFDVEDDKVYKI